MFILRTRYSEFLLASGTYSRKLLAKIHRAREPVAQGQAGIQPCPVVRSGQTPPGTARTGTYRPCDHWIDIPAVRRIRSSDHDNSYLIAAAEAQCDTTRRNLRHGLDRLRSIRLS